MSYYNERKLRDSNSDTVIGQVYTTTFIGLAIAAAGVHVHMHPSVLPPSLLGSPFTTASDLMTLAQFAGCVLIGLLTTCRAAYWLRFPIFVIVAWSAGLNVGSWVKKALQEAGFYSA